MLLSSNQVLRYVNALAVAADGLSINDIKPAEGAPINNISTISSVGAWPQMDQTFLWAHQNMIYLFTYFKSSIKALSVSLEIFKYSKLQDY